MECFVEFAIEALLSWAFVCWENFDCCFNSLTSNLSIQIFFFFIIQSWKIVFLGVYPFVLGCPIFWQIIVFNNLLWSFVFLWCHCYFSFISDVIYESSLFFISLAKVLLILFIFFKEPALSFIDLFCFSVFIFFCSDFYYFLPSTNNGLHLLFFF